MWPLHCEKNVLSGKLLPIAPHELVLKLQIKTWLSLLRKFLENSWIFVLFFQGPGKLLKKQLFSLYSWNTPGILCRIILYYKKTTYRNYRSCWFAIVFSVKSVARSSSDDFCGISLKSLRNLESFLAVLVEVGCGCLRGASTPQLGDLERISKGKNLMERNKHYP